MIIVGEFMLGVVMIYLGIEEGHQRSKVRGWAAWILGVLLVSLAFSGLLWSTLYH